MRIKVKPQGIRAYYMIEVYDSKGDQLWLVDRTGKFTLDCDEPCSSSKICKTIKAFKRFIKKHKRYLPKGSKCILYAGYVGQDDIEVIIK